MAFSATAFAQDAGATPPADTSTPPADSSTPPPSGDTSNDTSASVEFNLSTYFSVEQLSLLSLEEQATLTAKLSALSGDVLEKKVKEIQEWLNKRLEEQKEKMENQAQWEAKQKAKFEAKVDAQFAKLMREKKDAMERARRMQEKEERIKIMKAKRAEAQARRFSKPKVLQAWVASVDTVNGVILLKKHGAQAKVLVTAKTVLAVIEDDGARAGTLADFQTGDRIFGLVRRNPNDHSLVGVVLVKMQDRDNDDEDETPPAPPADSGSMPTPPADSVPPPA